MAVLRKAESTIIREMLGIPDEHGFARNLSISLSERTMLLDKRGGIASLKIGGGIDTDTWKRTMERLVNNSNKLGVDTLSQLYESCGIVDFDTYSADSLMTMRDFVNGDEALLATMRKGEVRVVMKDGVGDYNNAVGGAAAMFETQGEETTTLFFGLRRASDLYRPFALLKKRDIKPSSIVPMIHGNVGYMLLNGKYIEAKANNLYKGSVGILNSHVDRVFRERMQPHKTTGRREVVLVSCLQGKKEGLIMPTAMALAGKAEVEDAVDILAGSEPLNVRKVADDPTKLEFYAFNRAPSKPAQTLVYNRLPEKGIHRVFRQRHVGKKLASHIAEIR